MYVLTGPEWGMILYRVVEKDTVVRLNIKGNLRFFYVKQST